MSEEHSHCDISYNISCEKGQRGLINVTDGDTQQPYCSLRSCSPGKYFHFLRISMQLSCLGMLLWPF